MSTAAPVQRDSRHRFRIAVVACSVVAAGLGTALLATRDHGDGSTTRGVTATLRVPGHPGALVAGRDAIWLGLADAHRPVRDRPLLRLDLASGTVQRRILMGGQVTSLVHAGNRLLAAVEHVGGEGTGPSLVVALDWTTGNLLARRQFPGAIGGLAADGKDLWALQTRPGALLRLDPATLAPTAAPLALSSGRTLGLTVGAGDVWVTAADTGDVLRIDPATSTVERMHVGGSPHGIAVADGSVWLTDGERGEVVRRDLGTLRQVGKPVEVGPHPAWLARAGHYLFIGDAGEGTVSRIDQHTGKRSGPPIRVARPAEDSPAFTLAPLGGSVWVGSFDSNTLTRVSATPSDASVPAVTASSSVETSTAAVALPRRGEVVAQIAVPSGEGAFAVGEGAVWIVKNDASTLLRIDPERNEVVARVEVDETEAAAAGDGALWLSHPVADTVSRIDPRTNEVVARIHVVQPAGVAVTPDAVWVAKALDPAVARIDPATNRVVASIRVGPDLTCCSEHMGVFADGDAVWVAIPNGNRLVRIDPATNTVAETVKLPYCPGGFLVVHADALWSAGGGCADLVGRIDLATKALTRLGEPHPVGVGVAADAVWVAVLDSGNVDQIDPGTGRLVARLHVGGTPVVLATGFGSVWVVDDDGRVLRIDPRD